MRTLDDRVIIDGAFVTANGRMVRRDVQFTYRAVADGVRLDIRDRPGDQIELSSFARPGRPQVQLRPRSVARAASMHDRAWYRSGSIAELRRDRVVLQADDADAVSVIYQPQLTITRTGRLGAGCQVNHHAGRAAVRAACDPTVTS